jgi:hypothetical protein
MVKDALVVSRQDGEWARRAEAVLCGKKNRGRVASFSISALALAMLKNLKDNSPTGS